ncbi:MAG: thioredoxin family protein [Flavobacteriales bacterium]
MKLEQLNLKKEFTFNYQEYLKLMEKLVAENKTTGSVQTQELADYTKMNLQRMNRLNKTIILHGDLIHKANAIQQAQTWIVITETWCGDAAQNIPVIAHLAGANPKIELKLLLRDEHPEVMENYLTNGGKSIPKLIAFDNESGKELFVWGPRPESAQKLVLNYKNSDKKIPYNEFVKQVQLWYAKDATRSLQNELINLL